MYCFRKVGKEPGKLASSTRSCSESSLLMRRVCVCGDTGTESKTVVDGEVKAVGFADDWMEDEEMEGNGCEIAFWPVITLPSSSPAEI